jgi:hypothetical protein
MAGEWIKVEVSLSGKPEVMRLARILGIDADEVVGKLIRLWAWFDKNSVDGVVDGVVDADIDVICYRKGFAASLVSVGWLSVDLVQERISIPLFERHNGESAKKRALKNERQARWRNGVDAEPSTAASTAASTREEKRREDSSVAKATGGKPPAVKSEDEEKRELFDAGKSLLAEQGMPKAQCGSFIGKLAKDYGQAAALEAVRNAVVNRPMGAAEYLKATCQRLKGERKDPVTVPSDAAEKTAALLRQQEEHARHSVAPPANIRALVRKMTGVA